MAILPPFQKPDRIQNMFKFCHSLIQYRCYMLTPQALMYTEDSECELVGPFRTMPQEPWHPKRNKCNAKPVPWSSSHIGKCTPLQAEKQPEQWRALTTEINTSLHKDELPHVFNVVFFHWNLLVFLKICFRDNKGKSWFIWQEMELFYIILNLKQNHSQPSLNNWQYSRDYWDVFYVLFVIILISLTKDCSKYQKPKEFY